MSEQRAFTEQGRIVHETESVEDAETLRDYGPLSHLAVTVGNVDLPARVVGGLVYVQAPLPLIFEAFAEDLSAWVRDMEVRVSAKGGAPLSLDCDGRLLFGSRVAKSRVVRSGGKR